MTALYRTYQTQQDYMRSILELIKESSNSNDDHYRKFALEFAMQKDNTLNNMLMDYYVKKIFCLQKNHIYC